MAQFQPIQTTFHAGELSPRLFARTNTERYGQSLQTCENFLTLSHGPAVYRPGTIHITKARAQRTVRMVPFEVDLGEAFALEIGYDTDTPTAYIRFFDVDGPVDAAEQFIDNPSFRSGLSGWVDGSTGNSSLTWAAEIEAAELQVNNNPAVARLQQQVTVTAPANLHRFTADLLVEYAGTPVTLNVGTTAGASDINTFQLGNGVTQVTFTPGAGNATFWLSFEIAGTTATQGVPHYVEEATLFDDSGAATPLEFTAPWSEEEVERLQYAQSQDTASGLTTMYFASANTPQQRLIYNGAPHDWTFEPIPFTMPPPEWGPGNYPQCVALFEQRLWFARTANERDKVWGSQSGDFVNFDVGTALADEAIDIQLAGDGVVQWLRGAKNLLIGTDVAEYILTSSDGPVVPGNLQVEKQSQYGSAFQQPFDLGNGVVYVSPDERRLRFVNFQFLENSWVSIDLTWASEHVTIPKFKETHFKYSPDPLAYFVMRDGTMVVLTYEREQNLIGWTRHVLSAETPYEDVNDELLWEDATKARIVSLAALRDAQETGLFFAVERAGVIEIERGSRAIDGLEFQSAADQLVFRPGHLDSAVVRRYDTETTTVDGLDHLEGRRVRVINGGAVELDKVVVNGEITADNPGTAFQVGLGFWGTMKTLPLEGLNNAGTAQSLIRRWNRIFLRLFESSFPEVNGVVTGSRHPSTAMGQVQPLESLDLQVANLGRDRLAQLEIVQKIPLGCQVTGIFGDAGAAKL